MVRLFAAFALISLLTLPCFAAGADYGSRDDAVTMVKRVKAMFAEAGRDATFAAVSDKSAAEFHDRDLYPFIFDLAGNCLAHGARPALIGRNLYDLKDQDGRYLIRELVAIVTGPGSGWFDYKWPDPLTNKIEEKSSYVERMGNYFVGVGVYKR